MDEYYTSLYISSGCLGEWNVASNPGTVGCVTSRYRPDPDRILAAQLCGTATHHARYRPLTAEEHDAAVAELIELAAGRVALLAEQAGLLLGFYAPDDPAATRYHQAAQLLIDAGADRAAVDGWIEVGRQRAAAAAQLPFSGRRVQ
jgi:hypothetical protein